MELVCRVGLSATLSILSKLGWDCIVFRFDASVPLCRYVTDLFAVAQTVFERGPGCDWWRVTGLRKVGLDDRLLWRIPMESSPGL
jgi:hypothetical protein